MQIESPAHKIASSSSSSSSSRPDCSPDIINNNNNNNNENNNSSAAHNNHTLESIRQSLIRQEETIIFDLIERGEFSSNTSIYERNKFGTRLGGVSLLEYFLRETERVHAKLRRYASEDEYPFMPDNLPTPILPVKRVASILKPNRINLNAKILKYYTSTLVKRLCAEGDDGEYGSSANADISALQSVSRRIHFGKFVAEVKFRSEEERYTSLILAKDREGILEALTNKAVEERLLERVRLKASSYGCGLHTERRSPSEEVSQLSHTSCHSCDTSQSVNSPSNNPLINPDLIVDVYKEFIIPLTKEVEVEYLLSRLGKRSVSYTGRDECAVYRSCSSYFNSVDFELSEGGRGVAEGFDELLGGRVDYLVVEYENSEEGNNTIATKMLLKSEVTVVDDIFTVSTPILYRPTPPPPSDSVSGDAKDFTVFGISSYLQLFENEIRGATLVNVKDDREAMTRALLHTPLSSALLATSAEALNLILTQPHPPQLASPPLQSPLHLKRDQIHTELRRVETRCLVLSARHAGEPTCPCGSEVVMMQFDVPHERGALKRVLERSTEYNINWLSLQSFKIRDNSSHFTMLAEAQTTLEEYKEFAKVSSSLPYIRLLGLLNSSGEGGARV